MVFATALALGGWANVWVGRALRQHRSPGRTGALVLAVVNLFVLPFGTALAIYTFWVLLHNDARALFEPVGSGLMAPLHTEKTSTGLDANAGGGAQLSRRLRDRHHLSRSWRRRTSSSASTRCSRRWLFVGIVLLDILLRLVPILGALVVVFVIIPVSAVSGCC